MNWFYLGVWIALALIVWFTYALVHAVDELNRGMREALERLHQIQKSADEIKSNSYKWR